MKPEYRTLAGEADLPLMPPFRSRNLINRYFPLLADVEKLRELCDAYLNFTHLPERDRPPPEVGRFEPCFPFVFLIDINQPDLQVDRDRFGRLAQHELTFAIPVQWTRSEGGRRILEGTVYFNPFIYLNQSLGLGTGREVQGWPKQVATFESEDDRPRGPRTTRMSTFEPNSTGRLVESTVLRIERPSGNSPRNAMDAWSAAQNTMMGAWTMARQAWRHAPDLGALLSTPRNWFNQLGGGRDLGIITLKQVRDVANQGAAAYQALIHSVMRTDSVNGMGLLGEASQLWGDLTGGYRVRLHRRESQPIIDLLGLRVEREEVVNDEQVATLLPVSPCYLDLDITYEAGRILCARTRRSRWHRDESPSVRARAPRTINAYNGALRGSVQCLAGSFETVSTFRIFALPVKPGLLQKLCLKHFASDGLAPITIARPWVFLVAGEGIQSIPAAGRRWFAQSLGFYIRVEISPGPNSEAPSRQGLFAPYEFWDNGLSVTTARELWGSSAIVGEFSGDWVNKPSVAAEVKVSLKTSGFGSLYENELARNADIVDVRVDRSVPDQYAPTGPTLDDLLPGQGDRRPLLFVDLKQYRDVPDANCAAFQAISMRKGQIQILEAQDITEPLRVRIFDSALQPLVRILNLEGGKVSTNQTQRFYDIHPPAAFQLKARVRVTRGERLATRDRDGGWIKET